MGFIRVRAAEGPRHEFDVAEAEYAATPDVYDLLDPVPVVEARSPRYVTAEPDLPTPPPVRKSRKRK